MSFSRPLLIAEDQKVYQDESRSGQVLGEMHKFYKDERFCDIILCVEGRRFNCHRLVLAASSLYFERMFSNGMSEASAKEITLNDVSSTAVKYLVEFAYSSRLPVTQETALDIFEAADMLQFPKARQFCQDFLAEQITAQNCLHFMLYADAYSCEPLYEKAKVCAAQFFKVISPTDKFLHLPKCHVVAILKEDSLEMEYEEHVFEAMTRWILHDQDNRNKYLSELFKYIRLNYVSRWYLIEVICKGELINSSEKAQEILHQAKDQLLAQGHTYEIPWQLPPSRKLTGMTEKIIYVNTHDPTPGESELFLFDVVNKSWSSTSKSCPFASETSTIESFGDSLLVIGGWNHNVAAMNQKGAVSTVHEFKTMPFFPTLWYGAAHSMGISRYLHSSIRVGNKLYVLGGLDETQSLQATMFMTSLETAYQFDVCPRMLYPICRPAVSHYDNKIYVFGGFQKDGTPLPFIQQYDISQKKWSELQPPSGGLHSAFQHATCINQVFYLLTSKMDMSEVETVNTMVNHAMPTKCVDCITTFDPISLCWTEVYRLDKPRTGDFCVATLDGKIYITGGNVDGEAYNMVDCFNPADNTMEVIGNARDGCLALCTTMNVMHENFGL